MVYITIKILIQFFFFQGAFIEHGLEDREAYLYATLSFFGGFGMMLIIHKLVHLLDPENVVCSELDVDLLQIYGEDNCSEENEEEVDLSHYIGNNTVPTSTSFNHTTFSGSSSLEGTLITIIIILLLLLLLLIIIIQLIFYNYFVYIFKRRY